MTADLHRADYIERRAGNYLREKYSYLSADDYWSRWLTLRDKMQEALNDGVITEDEFEKVKDASGECWTWTKDDYPKPILKKL